MRIVNPVQGSRVLPYTGKPRTPAEKAERLPNGHYIFRITQTAESHKKAGGPFALDLGNHFCGDVVMAAMDGTYRRAPNTEGGNIIIGEHDGRLRTVYAHLSDYNIPNANVPLKAGAVIGWVGSTGTMARGCHLHYEVWENGRAVDPADFLNIDDIPTFVDVPVDHQFYEAIEWCRENGILYGIGDHFYPDRTATRGQLAAAFYRMGRGNT